MRAAAVIGIADEAEAEIVRRERTLMRRTRMLDVPVDDRDLEAREEMALGMLPSSAQSESSVPSQCQGAGVTTKLRRRYVATASARPSALRSCVSRM